jgi:hypothetical protein
VNDLQTALLSLSYRRYKECDVSFEEIVLIRRSPDVNWLVATESTAVPEVTWLFSADSLVSPDVIFDVAVLTVVESAVTVDATLLVITLSVMSPEVTLLVASLATLLSATEIASTPDWATDVTVEMSVVMPVVPLCTWNDAEALVPSLV